MYCSLATFTVELNETIKKECTTLIVMEENCLKLSTPVGKIEKQLQKDADQDIDLTGLCNTKTQPSFFYQFNNEVVVCVVNSALNPEDIYPLASVVRNIY